MVSISIVNNLTGGMAEEPLQKMLCSGSRDVENEALLQSIIREISTIPARADRYHGLRGRSGSHGAAMVQPEREYPLAAEIFAHRSPGAWAIFIDDNR
jgi:hypothetical protein